MLRLWLTRARAWPWTVALLLRPVLIPTREQVCGGTTGERAHDRAHARRCRVVLDRQGQHKCGRHPDDHDSTDDEPSKPLLHLFPMPGPPHAEIDERERADERDDRRKSIRRVESRDDHVDRSVLQRGVSM